MIASIRRRWRENWAHSWSRGRWEFEIEWVPRANGYAMFSLVRHSRPEIDDG